MFRLFDKTEEELKAEPQTAIDGEVYLDMEKIMK